MSSTQYSINLFKTCAKRNIFVMNGIKEKNLIVTIRFFNDKNKVIKT